MLTQFFRLSLLAGLGAVCCLFLGSEGAWATEVEAAPADEVQAEDDDGAPADAEGVAGSALEHAAEAGKDAAENAAHAVGAAAQGAVVQGAGHAAGEQGGAADHGAGGHHDAHLGAIGVKADPTAFSVDLSVYTFVVFLVLLAVLTKFAWGPISQALEKREHMIAENIAHAEKVKEESQKLLADYHQKLASAQDEVRAVLDEARRDAEHTSREILAKAQQDAQAEVERGRREIETATSQALQELAKTHANLAVDLAGRVIQEKLQPNDHQRLIDAAVNQFPKSFAGKN